MIRARITSSTGNGSLRVTSGACEGTLEDSARDDSAPREVHLAGDDEETSSAAYRQGRGQDPVASYSVLRPPSSVERGLLGVCSHTGSWY